MNKEFYKESAYLLAIGLCCAIILRGLHSPFEQSLAQDIIFLAINGMYILAIFLILGRFLNLARSTKVKFPGLRVLSFSIVYGAVIGGIWYGLLHLGNKFLMIGAPPVAIVLLAGYYRGLVSNHSVWYSIEHTISNMHKKLSHGCITIIVLILGALPLILGSQLTSNVASNLVYINTLDYTLYVLIPNVFMAMVVGYLLHVYAYIEEHNEME